jgi:hypothetical protein
VSIYYAVRKSILSSWLNDRDQFLYPNNNWKDDYEFQNDCFTYTLFNNNIQSAEGTNYWIPFTMQDVNSKEKFESSFMTDFIHGKLKQEEHGNLFTIQKTRTTELVFSEEATAVFYAGKELWKYYHSQPNCNENASLNDIREYFQGRKIDGKMNARSNDEHYMLLITALRDNLKILAKKIEPKVYEYEFLKS